MKASIFNWSALSRRHVGWLALLFVTAAVVGCGESRVPVFPVSGKVTFGDEIPNGAQITLHPVAAAKGAEAVVATGRVKEDGTFKITTYDLNDGAPAGDYVATIEWYKNVTTADASGPGPNVIPREYRDSKTSPVKVSVKSAPTEIPITIAKK